MCPSFSFSEPLTSFSPIPETPIQLFRPSKPVANEMSSLPLPLLYFLPSTEEHFVTNSGRL